MGTGNLRLQKLPIAECESVLRVDNLHGNLSAVDHGRSTMGRHFRTEAIQTALRILFHQSERSITATVAARSFNIGLEHNNSKFKTQIKSFYHSDIYFAQARAAVRAFRARGATRIAGAGRRRSSGWTTIVWCSTSSVSDEAALTQFAFFAFSVVSAVLEIVNIKFQV